MAAMWLDTRQNSFIQEFGAGMSIVQGVAGRETAAPPGGIDAAENADHDRDGNGHEEKLRVQFGFEQSADGRRGDEELHTDYAEQRSAHAAEKPEHRRFPQNHPDDPAAFPADSKQ